MDKEKFCGELIEKHTRNGVLDLEALILEIAKIGGYKKEDSRLYALKGEK